MNAAVLSLAHEAESRAWDDVVEADLLLTQDYLYPTDPATGSC
jgi:hypothetical protein